MNMLPCVMCFLDFLDAACVLCLSAFILVPRKGLCCVFGGAKLYSKKSNWSTFDQASSF